jgi:competence protein ComEA
LGSPLKVLSAVRRLRSPRGYSSGQQGILLLLALLIFGLMILKFYEPPVSAGVDGPSKEFVIEISGEVDQPGIYFFPSPPTLQEALARAGSGEGLPRVEDRSHSELLRTGTLLTVARTSDGTLRISTKRMKARKLLVFFIPLDLNRATLEDLCLIPGVGESLARDIVAYREGRRGFRTVSELRQVKGIGEAKWKALQDHLTVQ